MPQSRKIATEDLQLRFCKWFQTRKPQGSQNSPHRNTSRLDVLRSSSIIPSAVSRFWQKATFRWPATSAQIPRDKNYLNVLPQPRLFSRGHQRRSGRQHARQFADGRKQNCRSVHLPDPSPKGSGRHFCGKERRRCSGNPRGATRARPGICQNDPGEMGVSRSLQGLQIIQSSERHRSTHP